MIKNWKIGQETDRQGKKKRKCKSVHRAPERQGDAPGPDAVTVSFQTGTAEKPGSLLQYRHR